MADMAVSAQLQQWGGFDNAPRPPATTDSSASSPRLAHPDAGTLTLKMDPQQALDTHHAADALSLQERYLSSEEDLSPMEENDDSDLDADDADGADDASIHGGDEATFEARKMSVSHFEKGKSCDKAVAVSYVAVGRPKVIDLHAVGSPMRERTQRSASLAQLPMAAIHGLRNADQKPRLSLAIGPSSAFAVNSNDNFNSSRSASPASSQESRRPSTGYAPFSHTSSSLRISHDSSPTDASDGSDGSTRSNSPAVSEASTRTDSVSALRPALTRSSLHQTSTASSSQSRPYQPLTPTSPDTPSFLNSDPYENSMTSSASPIIKKSSPHRRLRSISMKLSLAKIAITPSTKKWDSRINRRSRQMPPTPVTPGYTPITPQTAPATGSFSMPGPNRLRRNSRSRPDSMSMRGPSPDEPPPMPTMSAAHQKLVARGANERAPILELPPCPDDMQMDFDPVVGMKSQKIRKRKSLMSLL